VLIPWWDATRLLSHARTQRTRGRRGSGDPPVSIGPEPPPLCPPISAIGGGPPFHPNCVHVLTPFVERLATEEEKKAGTIPPEVLNRTPAELPRGYWQEFGHSST